MNARELRNLQEAYLEVVENQQLDEAEGSYGQTPTARKAYGDLANKRRATPASEFAKRGEKTQKVKFAQKHFNRTGNPDAGNRGKKSTKPSYHSGKRSGMTQSDRDHARGEAEYGHTGYDPDFDGGPSAPGGKPKGKKLERQKKTGVSAESYDIYDIILSHLLDEGFAETPEAAEAIMVNMSEDWRDDIVEEFLDERNRGERGMSGREVTRRRNLGGNVRSKVSASSLGDHGPQSAIQKFHKTKANQRRAIHKSGRYTRGDTGESGGQGRYQANKDHSDGYPSITKRGQGPG